MSIASEISRIQTAKADLKTAIENKGVTVPSSTKLDGYADLVDSIEQGGSGTVESNDVEFIDYDGTIVASYSAAEFANLAAFPDNPDHTADGLVSQGWNWTLSEAKTYMADHKGLIIGQMYTTDDGATRITINLTDNKSTFYLYFTQSKTNGVTINWGDGSPVETGSSTTITITHSYTLAGTYIISLLPEDNCTLTIPYSPYNFTIMIGGRSSSTDNDRNSVIAINIGKNVAAENNPFGMLGRLRTITLSNNIGTCKFWRCTHLKALVLPPSITALPSNFAENCFSLVKISLPNTITTFGSGAFRYCYALKKITIPNSVTSLGSEAIRDSLSLENVQLSNYADIPDFCFYNCRSLKEINIPNSVVSINNYAFGDSSVTSVVIPDSVTSLGNSVFANCYKLQELVIGNGITNLGSGLCYYCKSLRKIVIPDNITGAFNGIGSYCQSLENIILPSTITAIGNSAFDGYYILDHLDIPSSVTSIGTSCINTALRYLVLRSVSPPTLGNASNSLGSTSFTFPIYVPDSAIEAYKSAYTNYASRIKGISER